MTIICVGDKVRHRGSSQVMEVTAIYGDYSTCAWHSNGCHRRRAYRHDELTPVFTLPPGPPAEVPYINPREELYSVGCHGLPNGSYTRHVAVSAFDVDGAAQTRLFPIPRGTFTDDDEV